MKPTAIDPAGCGCTECMVGEYVPLERATAKQIRKMLKGKLNDHTSERLIWDMRIYKGVKTVIVTSEYSGHTWSWEKLLE